jgi:hypothetical protein
VPLYPPQIPHGLTRAQTQASAVKGWRLKTRAMASRGGGVSYTDSRRKRFQNAIPACILLRKNFPNSVPACSVTKISLIMGDHYILTWVVMTTASVTLTVSYHRSKQMSHSFTVFHPLPYPKPHLQIFSVVSLHHSSSEY